MRVLLAVLLVGIAGCGGDSSPPGGGAVPTPEDSQAKTDKPPAQTTDADPAVDAQEEPPAVKALKALKVQLHYDEGVVCSMTPVRIATIRLAKGQVTM